MINEPTSFVDLKVNFTKKFPIIDGYNKNITYKLITKPIYLVNKISGIMTQHFDVRFIPGRFKLEYCAIGFKSCLPPHLEFSIREEDKFKSKLVDIKWGSFYTGNYELFLREKEAAEYSLSIISKKRDKLNDKIKELEKIINR